MDDEGFRHYLENDYSGSLSAKAVGDVISRCRRIEAAFNVDLSQGSDIEHLVKRLGEIVDDPNSWSVLRNALYRYRDYISRSEEHTSELQSLMRISYAVFCLKKTKRT